MAQPNWIRKTDQIPPHGQLVAVVIGGHIVEGKLCALDEPEIAAGRYLVDIDLWAVSGQYGYPIVTHWSLLPDSPTQAEVRSLTNDPTMASQTR
jgi:hypothetical protein